MKAYIWPLPNRVFHTLIVLFVAISWITSEWDNYLDIHAIFGIAVGLLILFRIVWGFIGPEYSKFSTWPLHIDELWEFAKNFLNPKKYAGHNPAASFVLLSILVVGILVVLSGLLAYGVQEGKGLFSFLHDTFFQKMEVFEELHEFITNIFFLLIFAHLSGVMIDRLLHPKTQTLKSIVTGYKSIEATSVRLNSLQKLFASLFFIGLSIFFSYSISGQNIFIKSKYKEIEYEKHSAIFVEECAACHTLYPPFLLPKSSWKQLMKQKELENHFGDDASLNEEDRISILNFLVKNSAEFSTKESANYILNSLKEKKKYIIAITDTPYWKKRHKNIDKNIFSSKEVKSKANCKACHTKVERGLLEDNQIKIPNGA
ncbi:hypothetical protein FJR45_08570 [Sulfurimonas sediminis]|uniref:Cytochrome b561 bacterial/Ni-hydrogenase domain-containing protein n=1 Tax=Sulfurimonas sediminis TaxID=2590020 RepID=A0A7M1B2N6_9BACT|nr:cytochrome b/b6 domain-containing protein [Sulfurimonas sediminis]QOP43993.1 hypothetical protein FJR45_08570 [Sulfurimonas sediminis]